MRHSAARGHKHDLHTPQNKCCTCARTCPLSPRIGRSTSVANGGESFVSTTCPASPAARARLSRARAAPAPPTTPRRARGGSSSISSTTTASGTTMALATPSSRTCRRARRAHARRLSLSPRAREASARARRRGRATARARAPARAARATTPGAVPSLSVRVARQALGGPTLHVIPDDSAAMPLLQSRINEHEPRYQMQARFRRAPAYPRFRV